MKNLLLIDRFQQSALLGVLLGVLLPNPCSAAPLPPVITEQPQSQSVEAGGSATFQVVVSSLTSVSYQWRKDGADIAGATNSSYTIVSIQPSNEADYSVEVANIHGSTTSDNATLTIANAAPLAMDDSYSVDANSTLVVSPPIANLANWWKFDAGGTSQAVVDSGALGNDGTRGSSSGVDASDPIFASGYVGAAALSFDGTDDYVSTPSTLAKTASAFTLSVWFKTGKTTGQQHILWAGYSGGNGYGDKDSTTPATCEMNLSVGNWDQDHKIVFFLGYDVPANGADPISILSTSDFTDTDRWHHAAVTVTDLGDGTFSASLYVDGVLEGTDTGVENDRSQLGSLLIGKPGASTRRFQGQIDEVRLYDSVLSVAQIQGLVQAGVLQNDSDADSRPIGVNTSVLTGPANGALILDADGSFSYTPNPNFAGTDTFTYKANDGLSDSSPATVTITVAPLPPPVLSTASSPGMTPDGFSFDLSVPVGATVVIEASNNMNDWMPIATNVAASVSMKFTDPAVASFPMRFYRAVVQ